MLIIITTASTQQQTRKEREINKGQQQVCECLMNTLSQNTTMNHH